MKTRYPPIAKISRPNTSSIVTRARVVTLLDVARNRPIVWVSAPAGSGKTSLVTSYLDEYKLPSLWYQVDEGDADIATFFYYMGLAAKRTSPRNRVSLPLLTPEYLQGITTFTRRYFESLYGRLQQPFILVFDNYQDVPLDSAFHEIMREGLSSVPDGINIIIISRGEPPPVFARLRASNRMSFVGWEEIRFDFEETKALILDQKQCRFPDEVLTNLYIRTEGWAAGIILLLQRMRMERGDPAINNDFTHEEVFHYFAGELFEKAGKEIQDFLLTSTFLPGMTADEAQELTGNSAAAAILTALHRNHFFTERHSTAIPVYQYHPLFREFLLVRAEDTLPAARMLELRRNAAALLERSGRHEPAAELMGKIGDWQGLARLINGCAQDFIAQGRIQTLEGWLRSFPEEYRVCSPWLLYWLGICRMPFDPGDSRTWLEKAFERFKACGDIPGAFLSWSSIVETFVHEWGDFSPLDRWILVLEGLLSEHPSFPSPEIEASVTAGMLNAFTYRQPHHADLPLWAERVKQIILKHQNVQLRMMLGNYLIIYYLWIGDFTNAGLVIDALRPVSGLKKNDPLTQQTWYVMEAMYSWFMADGKACMQAVSNGIKNAEDTGVHLLDLYLLGQGVYSGLSLGDPSAASSCLEKMSGINSPRPMDKAFYLYLASSVAWYQGDYKKAIEHGKLAVKLTGDVGCPLSQALCLTELAVTLFDDGQYEEADSRLSAGREVGRGMNHIAYLCFLHGARFAFVQNKEEQGLALLKQGLALGAQQDYVNMPRWNDSNMSRLCAKALEAGFETGYVHKLIRIHNLVPDGSTTGMESWPWPLKIYTLGRFAIIKDGVPISFSGKVQQKPLTLLKTLIALGGRDVAVEKLVDLLWPEADGDVAHQSFTTNLHRLRRLLDSDKVIRANDGKVTLDARYCWIDAWAFERLAGAVETDWKGKLPHELPSQAAREIKKGMDLYTGHFLSGEHGCSWSISMRERLRSKALRLIGRAGAHHEYHGDWATAAECYMKGLAIDDHIEEFHQRLMICHHRLGRPGEALAAYARCRKILATIGAKPCAKTGAGYEALLDGRDPEIPAPAP